MENNQQTNLKRSDSEDAMFSAKELIEFPTALREVKTGDKGTLTNTMPFKVLWSVGLTGADNIKRRT